jgi:flagellar assembly protein FliH
MPEAILIAFDRPLSGASTEGQAGRYCSEKELADRDHAAFRRGVDSERALADQQMVEFRADIGQLSDGLLRKISELEKSVVAQLSLALPGLGLEIARRLLAGYEPPPEVVSRLCGEALEELFPERENLELVVSTRDAALLEAIKPAWKQRYPGLRVSCDESLSTGDCQVRSRFGLIDARLATKLSALAGNLSAA